MTSTDLTPEVSASDHCRGPAAAAVTLVQYGDYECPFTASSHREVQALLEAWPTQVRFVFRHFPLRRKHLFAMRAAEAVEAAGRQGQFWEMHGALLRRDFPLGWEGLRDAAKALRLDLETFEKEVLDHVHRSTIERQIDGAMRSGVTSTPAYFVNGIYYDGPDTCDDFAAMIKNLNTR